MNESGLHPYKRVDPYTDAVFQNMLDGVFLKSDDGKKKLGSKLRMMNESDVIDKGVTYSEKKPCAAKEGMEEEGEDSTQGGDQKKEDATQVNNSNSTSQYLDVVVKLQHEIAQLKEKMAVREAGREVPSPPKKAKREQEGEGGQEECSNAGGMGVAVGTVKRDALLIEKIVKDNEEMRQMMFAMQYKNVMQGQSGGTAPMMQYPIGYSPFPSSNSVQMQQFGSVVSPYGATQQQNDTRDLPCDSRYPSPDVGRRENPDRPDLADTTPARTEGNGGRVGRGSFPSVNIPCVLM